MPWAHNLLNEVSSTELPKLEIHNPEPSGHDADVHVSVWTYPQPLISGVCIIGIEPTPRLEKKYEFQHECFFAWNSPHLDLTSTPTKKSTWGHYIPQQGFLVEFYRKAEHVETDQFSWIESLYEVDPNSVSPKDLQLLYIKINGYLTEKRFNAIDEIFRRIILDRTPTLVLIGLMRISFPARAMLREWETSIANIYDEIGKRGHNPDRMLHGLK